jgi:hypothetical protein
LPGFSDAPEVLACRGEAAVFDPSWQPPQAAKLHAATASGAINIGFETGPRTSD